MSETVQTHEPDHVITVKKDKTIYTVRHFFDGKEELADIIARRVLKDLDPALSIDKNGENA